VIAETVLRLTRTRYTVFLALVFGSPSIRENRSQRKGTSKSEDDAQPQLDDSRVSGITDHAKARTA
jgi:hypothetical protein